MGRLSHYRILKPLGEGAMGVVYLAEDTRLQRQVALKLLQPELAGDAKALRRFIREARTLAAVQHPHVVTIYEVGTAEGVTYLAMQLLRGQTLEDFLRKQPILTSAQLLRVLRELARGLAAIHERGLVHRDIKPGNLWLEAPHGKLVILDFGLALSTARASALSGPNAVVGTPQFMSPEQARGQPIDARADLFSMGVVAYLMATGRHPFARDDVMAQLIALLTADPVPVRQVNPEIPPALAELVHQLLAKSPTDRPASAGVVVQCLREMDGERRRRAEALGPDAHAAAAERLLVFDTPLPKLGSVIRRQRTAALTRWIGLVALLLLFIGLAIGSAWVVPEIVSEASAASIQALTRTKPGQPTAPGKNLTPPPERFLVANLALHAMTLTRLVISEPAPHVVGQTLHLSWQLRYDGEVPLRLPDEPRHGHPLGFWELTIERFGIDKRLDLRSPRRPPGAPPLPPGRFSAGHGPLVLASRIPPGYAIPVTTPLDTTALPPDEYRIHLTIHTPKRTLVQEALVLRLEPAP